MTKQFYEGTAMGEGFVENPVLHVQARQLARLRQRADGRPTQVLDLGCGAGTPTRALMANPVRFRVVGADLSPSAVAAYTSSTGRDGVRLDAQRLPFVDGAFDAVVSDDVVEHLVDTDAYAKEIHRVLSPGGWLFLSTPNLAAWFNRLALLVGVQPAFSEVSFEKIFGRPGDDVVGHLRLFTRRAICEFLDHHGFDVVDVRGARFDALPRRLRPVDALFAKRSALAGNVVIAATRRG